MPKEKTVKVRMNRNLHDELKVLLPNRTEAQRLDILWGTSTLRVTKIVDNVFKKKTKKK